jgi:hypothetical protein
MEVLYWIYLAASAHTCCNSAFYLHLYLVNKNKLSENSDSYTEVGRVPGGWRNEHINIWKSRTYFEVSLCVCTTVRRTQRCSSTVCNRSQSVLDGMQLIFGAPHDMQQDRYETVSTYAMKAYGSTHY